MANVTPSIAPGSYADPQSMRLALADAVAYVNYTLNGAQPAISEYIAYDTLSPPTPFIAVTQDGNGRVVYDGGFPKFYNANAGPAGIDPYFSMEYRGTRTSGIPAGTNTFYYDLFSRKNVTIAAGDILIYDIWQNSADAGVGLDAITANDPNTDPTHYSLRDWSKPIGEGPTIVDQNGLSIHPGTDLKGRPVQTWYHREFDLSVAAGYTFVKWSLAYEGEIPGTFYTRFKEVYVLDKNRKIKATLFKDTIDVPETSNVEGGASGYTNTSKTIYDPRTQLTASFKYLFNAINWVANADKVWAGNKKILVLGDAPSNTNYAVKSTAGDGFYNAMVNLAGALGFTATFKDINDFSGGMLDVRLAELEQYACVLLISSVYGPTAYITDGCVQDLQTFRLNGNGIILITDHGVPDLTDISQAYPLTAGRQGFYATANKVAVNFGAYFTGNYDRSPVNVGYIRQNYGDHPLYSGMANTESIAAGGSESQVHVATFTKYTSANLPLFSIPSGRTTIRVLAMLKDGTVETYQLVYSVASGELLGVFDGAGQAITKVDAGWSAYAAMAATIYGAGLGTLGGRITLNGTAIATLAFTDASGSKTTWLSGNGTRIKVKNGDVFKVAITSPFQYEKTLNVTRIQPNIPLKFQPSAMMLALRQAGATGFTPSQLLKSACAKVNAADAQAALKQSTSLRTTLATLRTYFA